MRSCTSFSRPMPSTVLAARRVHPPVAASSDAGSSLPAPPAAQRLRRWRPASPCRHGGPGRLYPTSASSVAASRAWRAPTPSGSAASSRRSTRHPRALAGAAGRFGRRFPGQVVERGGELIDNLHKTMLGYAQRFGLAREDVNKQPGEVFYVLRRRAVSRVGGRRRVPRRSSRPCASTCDVSPASPRH